MYIHRAIKEHQHTSKQKESTYKNPKISILFGSVQLDRNCQVVVYHARQVSPTARAEDHSDLYMKTSQPCPPYHETNIRSDYCKHNPKAVILIYQERGGGGGGGNAMRSRTATGKVMSCSGIGQFLHANQGPEAAEQGPNPSRQYHTDRLRA